MMGHRSGVAIDLGTVNTLVYDTGRGVVIDEPTAIAINRVTGSVGSLCRNANTPNDAFGNSTNLTFTVRNQ